MILRCFIARKYNLEDQFLLLLYPMVYNGRSRNFIRIVYLYAYHFFSEKRMFQKQIIVLMTFNFHKKRTVSCKPPQRKDKNMTSSARRVAHNHSSGLLLMNSFVADDTQKEKKRRRRHHSHSNSRSPKKKEYKKRMNDFWRLLV